MYYVFSPQIQFIDELNYASAVGKMPNFLELGKEWSWRSDSHLPVPFPKTIFSVDETIYQDAYKTGSIFDLHSEKLATLIRASFIKCEYFPINMVSSKSGKEIPTKYFVFHLMETYNAIDYAKSTLQEIADPVPDFILKGRLRTGSATHGKNIVSLVLTEEILSSKNQLFRDSERPRLVFVHEALKQKFDEAGIQGCKYTPYIDFHDTTFSEIGGK